MSKRMSRRILVITLIVFLIAVAVLDQRYWWWAAGNHIPVVTAIHMFMAFLWMVLILLHVFWLNRKPFFSFFNRAPNLSDRGVIQIIVLLLTLLFLTVIYSPRSWWIVILNRGRLSFDSGFHPS
jgi:hypothetical protein